jgi:hypothetical protein
MATAKDGATFKDLQYSIYVRERIERARKEADEGRVVGQDDIENRMHGWLDAE